MAFRVTWSTIGSTEGIDCSIVRDRTSLKTKCNEQLEPADVQAIGVVTKLMDMKFTLSIGIISCKIPGDGGRRLLIDLLKAYYPRNFRVTPNKSNE